MFFLFSSFHFITRIKTILIVTFIAIIVIAIAISISIVNVCSSKQFLFALSVCLSCRQSCCYWVRLGDFVALRVIRLLLPFHFISFHFIPWHCFIHEQHEAKWLTNEKSHAYGFIQSMILYVQWDRYRHRHRHQYLCIYLYLPYFLV